MHPTKLTVFNLFERPRRYVVPLYQRQYVWDAEEQWEPLWTDIKLKADGWLETATGESLAKQPTNHFLGAVVLGPMPTFGRQMAAYDIIDGQQRLTTLQVFLAALRDASQQCDDAALTQSLDDLTINKGLMDKDIERYKVWPTNADRSGFEAVMSAKSRGLLQLKYPPKTQGRRTLPRDRIVEAYFFFSKAIENYSAEVATDQGVDETSISEASTNDSEAGAGPLNKDRLFALFQALRTYLQVVLIELEDGDDPQVIFETLNARGVPLLPSDLVRNFVFLQATKRKEPTDRLYSEYWREYDEEPAEIGTNEAEKFWKVMERQGRLERPRLDLFLFHYLVYRTHREILIGHLFQEFRDWFLREKSQEPVENELAALQEHSKIFRTFFVPDRSNRFGQFVDRLRDLDTSTVYPLLLYLLGDQHNVLPSTEINGIATDLESFLVRRMVCGLTPKNYNNFFLTLTKKLSDVGVASREAIQSELLAGTAVTTRWPDNKEFAAAWLTEPAYGRLRVQRVAMILKAIDDQQRTDKSEQIRIFSKLDVEHVLPQGYDLEDYPLPPRANPESDPEQFRELMLHSFGNLTLLTHKLNASISNGPFDKKRPEICKQSALRLNTYFQTLPSDAIWSERAILDRGIDLLQDAIRVWPHPTSAAINL